MAIDNQSAQLSPNAREQLALHDVAKHLAGIPAWQRIDENGVVDLQIPPAWPEASPMLGTHRALTQNPANKPLGSEFKGATAMTFWLDREFAPPNATRAGIIAQLEPFKKALMRLAETDQLVMQVYLPDERFHKLTNNRASIAVSVAAPEPMIKRIGELVYALRAAQKETAVIGKPSTLEERIDRSHSWQNRLDTKLPTDAKISDVMKQVLQIDHLHANGSGALQLHAPSHLPSLRHDFEAHSNEISNYFSMQHPPKQVLALWLRPQYDVPLYASINPSERGEESAAIIQINKEVERMVAGIRSRYGIKVDAYLRRSEDGDIPLILLAVDSPNEAMEMDCLKAILHNARERTSEVDQHPRIHQLSIDNRRR